MSVCAWLLRPSILLFTRWIHSSTSRLSMLRAEKLRPPISLVSVSYVVSLM